MSSRRIWGQLPQIAQEFTQSVDWTLVAAERLYGADALRLVQARKDGEIIALAPLGVTKGGGVERLEILGATTLFEPCGFGYRDEEALATLCRSVVGLGRPLVLQRIEADGALLQDIQEPRAGPRPAAGVQSVRLAVRAHHRQLGRVFPEPVVAPTSGLSPGPSQSGDGSARSRSRSAAPARTRSSPPWPKPCGWRRRAGRAGR